MPFSPGRHGNMETVTLTTDFGESAYVAAMKGVILSIAPRARFIDITHTVPARNVREGAYLLRETLLHFPEAVHLAVVDPGVGTSRRPILAECRKGVLVGPDNGLLLPAAEVLGLERVIHLTESQYFLEPVSRTFHGRDNFAPVAGHLLAGVSPDEFGCEITDWVKLDLNDWVTEDGIVKGTVLHVDPFGNVITNIPESVVMENFEFGEFLEVRLAGLRQRLVLSKTYGNQREGTLIATISSSGYLEISCVGGSAGEFLGPLDGKSEICLMLSGKI